MHFSQLTPTLCVVAPYALAANVEDLWVPTFCVSTNLSKGEPAVHVKVREGRGSNERWHPR
jgi:hypothetical protein